MEVASGLAGGTLMTVAGQTMLAVAEQSMTDAPSVIIIGSGPSGIAMAHQLKHELGFSDFTVYEKQDGVGGRWRSYHQAEYRCPYSSVSYGFSFHQEYHWKNEYASQAELLAYMEDTVEAFDLQQHIHTSVEVIKAHWIDDKNTWCVRLRDLESGEEYNRYCTVLISAAGSGSRNDATNAVSITKAEVRSPIASAIDRYLPLARRLRRAKAFIIPETHVDAASNPIPDFLSTHASIEIIGARDDTSLSQYWKESRGPQAYWGSLLASFPNFGLISGPYAFPYHSSPLIATETCVAYLSRNLVSPILDNRATRVEVRQAVEDRWVASLRLSKVLRSSHGELPKPVWPYSAASFYLESLLHGSQGLVYKNGQTAWWMNMFVRWAKSIRLRTWLSILLGLALLRLKAVKTRVDRARADVEKYVPYEKQALEFAGKLKDTVLK